MGVISDGENECLKTFRDGWAENYFAQTAGKRFPSTPLDSELVSAQNVTWTNPPFLN